jgi:hypothetical protein
MYGLLYEIGEQEKSILDDIEGLGLGYDIKWVEVMSDDGVVHHAFTYVATDIDPLARPYSWYWHHVVSGAKQAGLPTWYVDQIEGVTVKQDLDANRHQLEMKIYGE